ALLARGVGDLLDAPLDDDAGERVEVDPGAARREHALAVRRADLRLDAPARRRDDTRLVDRDRDVAAPHARRREPGELVVADEHPEEEERSDERRRNAEGQGPAPGSLAQDTAPRVRARRHRRSREPLPRIQPMRRLGGESTGGASEAPRVARIRKRGLWLA